jgi:hypothetical protein
MEDLGYLLRRIETEGELIHHDAIGAWTFDLYRFPDGSGAMLDVGNGSRMARPVSADNFDKERQAREDLEHWERSLSNV